jgi:hypothetical protein
MVTQITLKTEGPHGLPSGRQTEVDPLYRGLVILTDYDSGHASHSRELMSRARTQRLETEASPVTTLRLARDYECTFCDCTYRRVSLAGIEPEGFRVKSDLRNHQAIVQPRLYDSLMVTQITLMSSRSTRPLLSDGYSRSIIIPTTPTASTTSVKTLAPTTTTARNARLQPLQMARSAPHRPRRKHGGS